MGKSERKRTKRGRMAGKTSRNVDGVLTKEQSQWTNDWVMQRARLCNIDRRDDRGTRELIKATRYMTLRDKIRLTLAHRFTQSRSGNPDVFRAAAKSNLLEAVMACKCGIAYQGVLSKTEVAGLLDSCADTILQGAPFESISSCASAIEKFLSVQRRGKNGGMRFVRPKFHAVEVAKDLSYFKLPRTGQSVITDTFQCALGPGARKGLQLVRKEWGRGKNAIKEEDFVKELGIRLKEKP